MIGLVALSTSADLCRNRITQSNYAADLIRENRLTKIAGGGSSNYYFNYRPVRMLGVQQTESGRTPKGN